MITILCCLVPPRWARIVLPLAVVALVISECGNWPSSDRWWD